MQNIRSTHPRFCAWALVSPLLALASCGGSSNDTPPPVPEVDAATDAGVAADTGNDRSDATVAVEAARPDVTAVPDAAPDTSLDASRPDGAAPEAGPREAGAPDAFPEAEAGVDPFACLGQPLPTTAPAMLQIGGITAGIDQLPIDAVDVEAFIGASTTAAAMTTSAATGVYSLTLATGGVPVDGYLRASKNGLIDSYFYAPTPVAASTNQATILLATVQSFTLLAGLAQVTPDPAMGTLVIAVVDCLGRPVPGASITLQPAGTTRYLRNNAPDPAATSTDATGLAAAFNVPAGAVMAGASAGGHTLRAHSVTVRANVLTLTSAVP
jgi:hypothetical protein